MQGYCDVYKWTILKRTSPEVKCLHLMSSRREMCTSSVSNVIYHKFSHGAAFYTLNGKNVNVMSEFIALHGRWGTTDDFATTPFHLVLTSAGLVELAKSILVHPLMLSSHLFFCVPLLIFPFTVSCRIDFSKPEDLDTWLNRLCFLS